MKVDDHYLVIQCLTPILQRVLKQKIVKKVVLKLISEIG